MRTGCNKWFGLSSVCVIGLAAAFMFFATGCATSGKCSEGAGMAKCKSNCASKCKTPCKNPDGTKKCAKDCKKPCCAKDVKKASATTAKAGCNKPCGAKGAQKASAKKGGCKPGCGSKAGGTKDGKDVASKAINKNCPVSGNPVRPGITAVSDGKTVGFCCGGCIGRWEAMTSAQKTEKLAASM